MAFAFFLLVFSGLTFLVNLCRADMVNSTFCAFGAYVLLCKLALPGSQLRFFTYAILLSLFSDLTSMLLLSDLLVPAPELQFFSDPAKYA